jgi:hypothetical protein
MPWWDRLSPNDVRHEAEGSLRRLGPAAIDVCPVALGG